MSNLDKIGNKAVFALVKRHEEVSAEICGQSTVVERARQEFFNAEQKLTAMQMEAAELVAGLATLGVDTRGVRLDGRNR